MVGRKCVVMKKQCILEVFEQFYIQLKKTPKNQNTTNKPKSSTEPIINPKVFTDKHLATYIAVLFWLLFLMLNKNTVIMGFFFNLSYWYHRYWMFPWCYDLLADGVSTARESGMKIPFREWAGTLLKVSARLVRFRDLRTIQSIHHGFFQSVSFLCCTQILAQFSLLCTLLQYPC